MDELMQELKDYDGYASDTPFQPSFGASGPNKVRRCVLSRSPTRVDASPTPSPPSRAPLASQDISNIIFVENLPKVPEDKVAKLISWSREKVFSKVGACEWRARVSRAAALPLSAPPPPCPLLPPPLTRPPSCFLPTLPQPPSSPPRLGSWRLMA